MAPRCRVTRFTMLVLVGLAFSPSAKADGPVSFAGQWAATPLVTAWSIGDWGDACGPRPSGGGERGGTATIQEVAGELIVSGIGFAYDTSSCWERLPGIQRTSHSASARAWRTTCRSPPSDPRQSSLVTTVTANGADQLGFDETGQYQFVIKGQNCTASVRRTRTFRRLVAAPAPVTTTTASALAAAPSAKPGPKDACQSPGPPARIEVRPSHKLIRAGEEFAFRAAVVNARGCQLGVAPAFRLDGEPTGVRITPAGKVTVEAAAPAAEVKVLAQVGNRSVEATLHVVSRERYEAMLAEGGFDPSGASADAAIARLESGSVGSRKAVLEDESTRKRALFVGVVGFAALGLGVAGLTLVSRSRRRARAASRPQAQPVPLPAEPARPPTVCPTCREEYPPETQFCPKDGNRVVPLARGTSVGPAGAVCPVCGQGYDPGVAVCPKHDEPLVPSVVYAAGRAAREVETKKICPVCGAQWGGKSEFCGGCGAALVPVN